MHYIMKNIAGIPPHWENINLTMFWIIKYLFGLSSRKRFYIWDNYVHHNFPQQLFKHDIS